MSTTGWRDAGTGMTQGCGSLVRFNRKNGDNEIKEQRMLGKVVRRRQKKEDCMEDRNLQQCDL